LLFKKINTSIISETEYRIRIMYGLIFVLVGMILTFRLWPVTEITVEQPQEIVFTEDVLIDDIEITRQQSAPPPPPRPQVPQPVPVDEIIEDVIEIDTELQLVDFPELPDDFGTGIDGDEEVIVSNPQLPPSVVRIVEPSVPELPNELRGRIEMVVNFLVNSDGTVEEASIVEVRKYDENREEYEVLPFIQYGLMGATLEAALNWRFRAARHDGAGVRTYTTATFNY
jgi:hypothetical protein